MLQENILPPAFYDHADISLYCFFSRFTFTLLYLSLLYSISILNNTCFLFLFYAFTAVSLAFHAIFACFRAIYPLQPFDYFHALTGDSLH